MRTPPETRFWRHVEKTPTCWVWTGATEKGYGRFGVAHGDVRGAHRFSWEMANGPVPDDLYVLHRCDNPPCVRPDHLWLGTAADNWQDCLTKQRRPPSYNRGTTNAAARLTESQVAAIRERLAEGASQRTVAREFGISRSQVQNIQHRRSWA